MSILIKNAEVLIDNKFVKNDILIDGGKIVEIGKPVAGRPVAASGGTPEGNKEINAEGLTVLPGFIDMHCHLRDPGYEYKEDIISGTKAAAKGGFTAVCCMPNTNPVIDNPAIIHYIKYKSEKAFAKVYPIAAITVKSEGRELCEIGTLKEAGAVAVSDDGKPVSNAQIMRNAMQYCKGFNMPIISHCEDLTLADDGAANEGFNATISGIKGITRAAEEVMTARDIILAETLNAKVHITHVSTKGSVELIRNAKKRGVRVTCDTCPHYFTGTDDLIVNYDTNAKVNPPLREKEDVEAIKAGIADGTIDAISTDHAPHSADEKNAEFSKAPNGISGIEVAFALCYNLVKEKIITLEKLSALLTDKPSEILSLEKGVLKKGGKADLVIIKRDYKNKIDVNNFISKGKNNPFNGTDVFAKVCYTICGGVITFEK